MKKVIIALLIFLLFLSLNSLAGPFDTWDEEANVTAQFVRKILGGDSFDESLKLDYPGSTINWGGRISTTDKFGGATYIVYCEIVEPQKDPTYYYYEVAFSPVNDNPQLLQKYNIGY
ncbi:MAG: hypothetical protein P9L98_04685 [Candidatus Kaelpia imicola]|nr:hypothetical protein [Candidatus Kaelpia imicola]